MNGLNKLFIASLASLSFIAMTPANAGNMPEGAEFIHALKHSNFIPPLMRVVMENKETLALTKEQMDKLKNFHSKNSTGQREDMMKVVKLEKAAAKAALNDNLTEAQILGQQSIALRQTLMNQKLRCHLMMKQTLSPEQFKKLLELAGKH